MLEFLKDKQAIDIKYKVVKIQGDELKRATDIVKSWDIGLFILNMLITVYFIIHEFFLSDW